MTLSFESLDIPAVKVIRPRKYGDDRGFFSETFSKRDFAEVGIDVEFVQDNHSLSRAKGVLRGLHYQLPPFAQDKLVRVTRGRVFDVAVDVRKGSPTYAHWVGVELSAEKWNQLFVPKGFAHAYLTLEPDTEFLYKVSNHYAPECIQSIRFDDPAIGIAWPGDASDFILSPKDANAPVLANANNPFVFGEIE